MTGPEDAADAPPELPRMGQQPAGYRSGFVAVVGLPNVGKSSLVNALVGREVLITSDKPQTTRHQIRCVSTSPARQILFVDTPGWLENRRSLDGAMLKEIQMGLDGVDLVVYLVDGTRPELGRCQKVLAHMRAGAPGVPVLVVLSKMDKLGRAGAIPLAQEIMQRLEPDELIPVSSLTRDNLEALDGVLTGLLPEGPLLYPPDMVVDRPEAFLAAEFIREQIFRITRQEVPFSTAVEIEAYRHEGEGLEIEAVVLVDRKSQKGILLGKQGRMIHEIQRRAVRRLKAYTGATSVELTLFVKVVEGWRDRGATLADLGIGVES